MAQQRSRTNVYDGTKDRARRATGRRSTRIAVQKIELWPRARQSRPAIPARPIPARGRNVELDKAAREAAVEDTFIAIAKKLENRGEELSVAQTSHGYAPTIIARQPEAKGIRKTEFVTAMERLIDRGRVHVDTLRPGRTREKKIIRVGH